MQTDEINRALPETRECICKLISDGYIKIIPTNGAIAGTNEPSRKGFIASRLNMAYLTSEKEANLLQNKMKINMKSPMKNSADILILYAAIKQRIDYLVTDDKDLKFWIRLSKTLLLAFK